MIEIAIDTLPGPTHTFSGLSQGNKASQANKLCTSSPKQAALECLRKMEIVASFGIPQFVLPPFPRPDFATMQQFELAKTKRGSFSKMKAEFPDVLRACFSSSSMWSANVATITPSIDTSDKKIHITPANLGSHLHRSSEVKGSSFLLQYFFKRVKNHTLHPPLPSCLEYFDEGAANTLRLSSSSSSNGLQIFVFGRKNTQPNVAKIARQAELASKMIAAQHMIPSDTLLFLEQHQGAIEAGAFHNDVISFAHKNIFAFHEKAFENSCESIQDIINRYEKLFQEPLYILPVHSTQLSLEEAVKCYFFNSQLLTCPKTRKIRILAPIEASYSQQAIQLYSKLELSFPIESIHFIETTQSMMNGGGPACLRLQLPVSDEELSQLPNQLLITKPLLQELRDAIESLYPENLLIDEVEFGDIALFNNAIHAIWILLGLGSEWKKIATLFGIPHAQRS
jgi:succinylarginine dihydrolase